MDKIISTLRKHPYGLLVPCGLLVLAVWQILSYVGVIEATRWSAPLQIAFTIGNDMVGGAKEHADQNSAQPLIMHTARSLTRFGLAFGCAAVVGVGAGFFLGISKTLYGLGHPIVNFLRALPSAAIWPVCALLVGFGHKAQMLVICFGATWPALINSMDAVRTLPAEIHDSLTFMRIGRLRRWWALLCWAAPTIFTGLEVSCAVAFLLTITVEIFWPANGGLGWYLSNYTANTPDAERLFGGVMVIALLGWCINTAMRGIRSVLLFWEASEPGCSAKRPVGDAKALIAKVRSELSREVLRSDKVTETIESRLSVPIVLEVLYQGKAYMLPEDVHTYLNVDKNRLVSADLMQRDIRILNNEDGLAGRALLFSRSWIRRDALTPMSQQKLDERRETIGRIIRQHESQCRYRTLWYQDHISDKLGMAFGSLGTIEAVQRARIILLNGNPAILIHEFVPV